MIQRQLAWAVAFGCAIFGCSKSDKGNSAASGSGSAVQSSGSGSASAPDSVGSAGSAGSATGSATAPVTSAPFPEPDKEKAKAANVRGYKLHKEKKYAEAAAEYRNAIAADPGFLLAHYNLACAASLTKDKQTALAELAWLADRSSWDESARSAAEKSRSDRDLEWIRNADEQGFALTGTDTAEKGAVDVLDWVEQKSWVGAASNDVNVTKTLAGAPGKHEEACSSAAFAAKAFDGNGQAVANLRDGVALLDGSGAIRARSEPLGCAASADKVTAFNQLSGIAAPLDMSEEALWRSHLFVVQSSTGDKRNVALFLLKDGKEIVRVFDAVTKSDAGDGSLLQTPVLGDLVYTAPGDKRKKVYRFNPSTWKYAQVE